MLQEIKCSVNQTQGVGPSPGLLEQENSSIHPGVNDILEATRLLVPRLKLPFPVTKHPRRTQPKHTVILLPGSKLLEPGHLGHHEGNPRARVDQLWTSCLACTLP